MNRRRLFGILAAPVAAAKMPVQSETRTKLKPYSAFNYNPIYTGWGGEYIRKRLGASCSSEVLNSCALYGDNEPCYSVRGVKGYVPSSELQQAFADACLNGEVPGVWWE